MENTDLESGNVEKINQSVQRLFDSGKKTERRSSPSIQKVSNILRNVKPSCFYPKVVSIGPLHKQNKSLQAFEGQKASYMMQLISRRKVKLSTNYQNEEQEIMQSDLENSTDSQNEEIMKSILKKVYSSMERIKAFYDWPKDPEYDDSKIAEMMVMDSCFILEFICQVFIEKQLESFSWFLAQKISYDLVLLENQIPLFLLNDMFECTLKKLMPPEDRQTIIDFIRPLICFLYRFGTDTEVAHHHVHISINHVNHILGLLHQYCIPEHHSMNKKDKLNLSALYVPSVVDLDRAGISFKPHQNRTWDLRMEVRLHKFLCCFGPWSKATVKMPIFRVNDSTELIFRNLIAYEQLFDASQYIASYAFAMDVLVSSPEDVAKLVDSGILVNLMGSNEEVADTINRLCKNVEGKGFYYTKEWNILNEYCGSYWPRHIAKIRSTYFDSPWNIIALGAAIILFALTILQTVYTIIAA